MTEDRNGQVITFYSFKGGTGRTMALANVAWILAEQGKHVLVADWDLESPGLHRFFSPFIGAAEVQQQRGVINMIREFENAAINPPGTPREPGWEAHYASTQRFAFPITYPFAAGGSISFLTAGMQNHDYKAGVTGLDWDTFYNRLGGQEFLDALRADMKRRYDYTFIDSRTGLSDVADICTIHLPDVLVDCFTLSEQGIDGAADVARSVGQKYKQRGIRVLPVPMRVDPAEKDKADAGRQHAMSKMEGLPAGLNPAERSRYWLDVEVPYLAYYAYEETLATFGDEQGAKNSLLTAYEKIAAAVTEGEVTEMPRIDPGVRSMWRDRFLRKRVPLTTEVVVYYAPKDHLWYEWVERLFGAISVTVVDGTRIDRTAQTGRPLAIVSASYLAAGLPRPMGSLAVFVDDSTPQPEFRSAVYLKGMGPAEAARRVIAMIGGPADIDTAPGARYPGEAPAIQQAPIRNHLFTGRDETLRAVRSALTGPSSGPPALVALHGSPGIGKTQVALEYVHRFGAAYDLIWWIGAEPRILIDTAVTDLGDLLELPRPANVTLGTRAVREALRRGVPYGRWLLVFDNVGQYGDIERFLPGGHGHVLVTTRDKNLTDAATAIEVDTFARIESVQHLRQRVPDISAPDANDLANALGDLPIAIATGGAALAERGTPVAEYLEQLAAGETEIPVQAVYDLSLDELQQNDPVAYRLMEVLSVLAPDISLDLIHHNAMVDLLRASDPSRRRPSATRTVQKLSRLALLKLDHATGRIQVHRMLQAAMRQRMGAEHREAAQRAVLAVLTAAKPEKDVDDRDAWDGYRALWPHLEIGYEQAEVAAGTRSLFLMAVASDQPAVLELLVDRIRYVWVRGPADQCDRLATRIENAWRQRLATVKDPVLRDTLRVSLLRAQFNHANALRQLGRFQEAFDLDTATHAEQSELLGETHLDTLMTAGGLGGDLRALGRYDEALKRDRATHATLSMEYGDTYRRTLAALNNLATSLRLAGYYAEARAQDEFALQRREAILGRRAYYTLWSQAQLGRDLRELGDYERSIAMLTDAFNGYSEDPGPDAAPTLSTHAHLAVSLRSQGKAELAQTKLDDCYTALLQYGADYPDTLACQLSRATNLLSVGRLTEAKNETIRVLDAYRRNLTAAHPHTLVCENNLSAIERALGNVPAALAMAERAVEGLALALRPDHPVLLAAQANQAVYLFEAERADEARPLADEVAATLLGVLGDKHPDALRALANARLMRSERGTADPEVLADLTVALGPEHPAVRALQEGRLLHRVLDPGPF
ncbi:FxSxx-COOH system tetratricopeptide repeat protein [Dactylosporangium salmoneum]|uniref:FxSxx-COOH system tetratricopeptide repeat protein n=1 Tax=Dactylosporangium salmoneum TaxID=53361 RepID=A0ABN3GWN5_9ACTN